MRYVLAHQDAHRVQPTVEANLRREKQLGLDRLDTFAAFAKKIEQSRTDLVNLLKRLKADGQRVAGYGATSKSTTILNYCDIGPDLVEFISDTTPIKHGKYTPGMHIPVVPYDQFQKSPPDYAVLFAWNHSREIMAKERDFMAAGGKWILHVPEVHIIE
jgi:methylation protein EvaC